MKLTLQIKLLVDQKQKESLLNTMEAFNDACNFISDRCQELKTASKFKLQKDCYYTIREKFNLSAQMAIRAFAKVAATYKTDKKKHHKFRKYGAMVLDNRLLSYKSMDRCSILSLDGRLIIPFVIGEYFKAKHYTRIKGEADLVYRNHQFFLYQVCDIPEKVERNVDTFLGVDLGVKNIATDSKGKIFSGDHVNGLRRRYAKVRKRLQHKGTKSAKRLLVKRKHKEQRFVKNINHIISKKLVDKAECTDSGIKLEDLQGIRSRIKARKSQRRQQHSWSFYDLRTKIEYKAKLRGVPVVLVDPKYTSQECSECGHVSKSNRKSQSVFVCTSCGFSCHADVNAAINIEGRAPVNEPYVEVA